jgi:hypothetical protein
MGTLGPYDDLVAALDHAADLFGDRKVVMWCMEWAIARNPDPRGSPVHGGFKLDPFTDPRREEIRGVRNRQ